MTPVDSLTRRAGGLGAPKLPRSEGGFTLIEIALVALIVGLLSTLAVATVRHLQQRAARSTILNNLRQLHEAKEHYFFESGENLSTPRGLAQSGYLRQSVGDRVTSGATFEAHLGWHYGYFLMPGQPTYAYQGTDPGTPAGKDQPGVMKWSQPTGEVIWYPAPPADLAAAATGSPATAATTTPTRPTVATTPTRPAAAPVRSGPQAPTVSATIAPRRMGGQSQTVHASEIKAQVGAASPDGRSPISISGIQLDPSVGTVGRGTVGGTWQFQWQGPATGQTHYATVTLDNGHGQTTVEIPLVH
jgi:type II secretory pathway pseudopilin PulG